MRKVEDILNSDGIFVVEENDNIYIVPDIHGDYECVVHILVDLCCCCKIVKLFDDVENGYNNREYLEWIDNNNSTIVFCGDIIHRKRFEDVLDDECSDIFILQLLFRLQEESERNGGKVIIISGNHEILNITYPNYNLYTSSLNISNNFKYFTNQDFLNNYISRSFAWIIINDILITHGGICSDYLEDKIIRNMMNGNFNNNNNNGTFNNNNNNNDKTFNNNNNNNDETFNNNNNNNNNNDETFNNNNDGTFNNNNNNNNGTFNNNNNNNNGTFNNSSKKIFNIVSFINNKYHEYFNNFDYRNINKNNYSYGLFIEYNKDQNSTTNNMFWCREFGYPNIKCQDLHKNLNVLGCKKMIITHCPQFLNKVPLMVNFECDYTIARLDLGFSRAFDYNKNDATFGNYIANNHYRKIAVLKLKNKNGFVSFDESCVVTKKLSCVQYVLLKYGTTKNEWINKGKEPQWVGFNYINKCLNNNDYKNICCLLDGLNKKIKLNSCKTL